MLGSVDLKKRGRGDLREKSLEMVSIFTHLSIYLSITDLCVYTHIYIHFIITICIVYTYDFFYNI